MTEFDADAVLDDPGPVVAEFTMDVGSTLAAFRRAHEAAVRFALTERQRRFDRLAWSGPNRMQRQIARAFRIKPKLLGVGPPPLAIDGRAYRRRQKNRVKRRKR